jgi:3-phenylpropionate/trans-cinnamate dioxygenase ferredoxin subunit
MELHEVAAVEDIPEGTLREVTVADKEIALANVRGTLYAFQGRCSHMGAVLADGRLEEEIVECPRHGSRFDVTTGKKESGPHLAGAAGKALGINRLASALTRDLETYRVVTEDGTVKVEL